MPKRKRLDTAGSASPSSLFDHRRLRSTPRRIEQAKERMETPRRQNSLFDHFSRDVRNLIYGYINPTYPFKRDPAFSGLYLSCRQSKQEIEEEQERDLYIYLQKRKANLDDEHMTLHIPTRDLLKGSLELTFNIEGGTEKYYQKLEDFAREMIGLVRDKIRIHFVTALIPGLRNDPRYLCHDIANFITKETTNARIKHIALSWNCHGTDDLLSQTLSGTQNRYQFSIQNGQNGPTNTWTSCQIFQAQDKGVGMITFVSAKPWHLLPIDCMWLPYFYWHFMVPGVDGRIKHEFIHNIPYEPTKYELSKRNESYNGP